MKKGFLNSSVVVVQKISGILLGLVFVYKIQTVTKVGRLFQCYDSTYNRKSYLTFLANKKCLSFTLGCFVLLLCQHNMYIDSIALFLKLSTCYILKATIRIFL